MKVELIILVILIILLVWAIIELKRVNSKLNDFKKKQDRHDNVQSVILEQVDEIREKMG